MLIANQYTENQETSADVATRFICQTMANKKDFLSASGKTFYIQLLQ